MAKGHFVLAWSLLLIPLSAGNKMNRLYDKLLNDYKPYIRPRVDPYDTIDVSVSFTLMSVEGLYENTQTLVSSGYFYFTWTDELLKWNASEYSNITTLTMPWERIWSPDVSIHNSVEDISQISNKGGDVRLYSTGKIDWYVGTKETTNCALDMTKFPFDSQTCSLKLVQWTSQTNEVNISAKGILIDRILFKANGEWEIEAKSFETVPYPADTTYQSELIFTFAFNRKYTYFLTTNILPVMLLSVLNLGVFLVPPESGEKISLCISIVLSYAVFLTVINDSLPEVSEPLSIFGVYLVIMMFLKVMTTLASLAILKIYYTEPEAKKHKYETNPDSGYGKGACVRLRVGHMSHRKLAEKINFLCFIVCAFLTVTITLVCFLLMVS